MERAADLPAPAGIRLPDVDVAALLAQDAINDQDKTIPYRFGYNHVVDLGIGNAGAWHVMEDGTRLWRLGIECPDALSINLEFHDFAIPDGARVFLMNAAGQHIGAFTNANDDGTHVLGVMPLRGSMITVEYQVPAGVPTGQLRIGQVTHGYRDVFGHARGLGDSGSCNNNVICSVGDAWRDQIRSVAMIVVNGNGACTGTMINNCAQNGTPYFLTANHCVPGNNNVSTWVFRFNWESPVCGQNQNGPTNQTVSGATVLYKNSATDVALLQLNSTPPASYQVYYSGWDRSGNAPNSSTGIHHPAGDIKKISFDNHAATQATYGGASCWRIATWEDGTTEPGSSGSGLWNQNKRLIGQLYGGQASCSNNVNDYYGRFDLSYPNLQTWLGSCGNTLDGYDPNAPSVQRDAQITGVSGTTGSCSSSLTPVVTVRNGGTATLTSFQLAWSVTGGGSGSVPWTGSLASTASTNISLGSIAIPAGTGTLTVTVNDPNGQSDQAPGNDQATRTVAYHPAQVTLQLNLDQYGNETTWEIRTGAVIHASGGPYTEEDDNGVYPLAPIQVCVPDGCHELVVYDSYGDGMCCAYGSGSFTLRDAENNVLVSNTNFSGSNAYSTVHAFCVTSAVRVAPRVFLQGPYGTGPLMSDALRSGNMVPAQEPYTQLGFTHAGGGGGETVAAGVLNVSGTNAIVDWVLVELRTAGPAYAVVATRSALVQRDGDVVDTDGVSPVAFTVGNGNYHVVVRHRNHLGVMSASTVALSGTAATVDFRLAATATYGTQARATVGTMRALWAGNTERDGELLYTGQDNDRDPILDRIGGVVPTSTVGGYHPEDVDLNGVVRYTGASNDRDFILQNIGGVVPTASRSEQLP